MKILSLRFTVDTDNKNTFSLQQWSSGQLYHKDKQPWSILHKFLLEY